MSSIATDWEEGKPPVALEVDAFVLGHVRRGWRRNDYFVFVDCTHPQQNIAADLDLVTHWRARESVVVIEQQQSMYSGGYVPQGIGSFMGGVVASMFGF